MTYNRLHCLQLKPGVEGSGIGEANFRGDGKHELPVKEGEMPTIMCEDGCPSGKCLVKNNEGHLGYVPKEIITCQISSQENGDSENITEDFYEDVDQYQSSGPKEGTHEPELYDDLAEEDAITDDIYEELPDDSQILLLLLLFQSPIFSLVLCLYFICDMWEAFSLLCLEFCPPSFKMKVALSIVQIINHYPLD